MFWCPIFCVIVLRRIWCGVQVWEKLSYLIVYWLIMFICLFLSWMQKSSNFTSFNVLVLSRYQWWLVYWPTSLELHLHGLPLSQWPLILFSHWVLLRQALLHVALSSASVELSWNYTCQPYLWRELIIINKRGSRSMSFFLVKKKIWFQSLAFLLHLKIFAIDKFSNWDFWPMTTVANKIQARYEQSWQCSQLTSNGLSHQLWGVIYEAMISCSIWTSVIPLFLEQITMCPMNGLSGVGFS